MAVLSSGICSTAARQTPQSFWHSLKSFQLQSQFEFQFQFTFQNKRIKFIFLFFWKIHASSHFFSEKFMPVLTHLLIFFSENLMHLFTHLLTHRFTHQFTTTFTTQFATKSTTKFTHQFTTKLVTQFGTKFIRELRREFRRKFRHEFHREFRRELRHEFRVSKSWRNSRQKTQCNFVTFLRKQFECLQNSHQIHFVGCPSYDAIYYRGQGCRRYEWK